MGTPHNPEAERNRSSGKQSRNRLAALKRRHKRLADLPSQAEEEAATLEWEITELTELDVAAVYARRERLYASSLRLIPLADGSAKAVIDGNREYFLPPLLHKLLVILADAENGAVWDALVGWKHIEDVRKALGADQEREISRTSLTSLVWRLRQALGKDRHLVQTRRAERLIRFALKRGGADSDVIST